MSAVRERCGDCSLIELALELVSGGLIHVCRFEMTKRCLYAYGRELIEERRGGRGDEARGAKTDAEGSSVGRKGFLVSY